MPARWLLPATDPVLRESLSRELGLSTVTAQVLMNRGLRDAASARAFLNPQLNDLVDPDLLPGMGPAVDRILEAAREKQKVLVYHVYWGGEAGDPHALRRLFYRFAGFDEQNRIIR